MSDRSAPSKHPETLVQQVTRDPTPGAGLGLGIEQHATWSLRDTAEGGAFAREQMPPRFYTRWGNPTTQRLEAAVAGLEGAEAALATGSGMGAIASTILHLARKKKHIVAQRSLYSATAEMLTGFMDEYGVRTDFVQGPDTAAFEAAIVDGTALVYLETPSNPTMEISDIAAISALAAEHDVPVVVDNTFASPLNQRPLELGATFSLHSATKYLGGHSDVVGGVVSGPRDAIGSLWDTYKMLGPTLAPNDAFLIHRGIKTLALRIRQHNENAMAVARFLEGHDAVEAVHYPGLPSHPQHELARRQMKGGFGGMLAFRLRGGFEAGRALMESTRLCVLGVSLGGVETLIQHPASMTHGPLGAEGRKAAGIDEGLIRLSVGCEAAEDIIRDLDDGL